MVSAQPLSHQQNIPCTALQSGFSPVRESWHCTPAAGLSLHTSLASASSVSETHIHHFPTLVGKEILFIIHWFKLDSLRLNMRKVDFSSALALSYIALAMKLLMLSHSLVISCQVGRGAQPSVQKPDLHFYC